MGADRRGENAAGRADDAGGTDAAERADVAGRTEEAGRTDAAGNDGADKRTGTGISHFFAVSRQGICHGGLSGDSSLYKTAVSLPRLRKNRRLQ